ncbi:LPS-assembly protein LptD [Psychrobacter frigidicola]|uniref:LPS-assembly protein LptD n=1 Tax=Psychrobacter frigidicola TaxID=45611 RepID=A0A5C7A5U8_9GAMM|nr:LPS assembly protein LptD [Psychrobacter frigidicola]TXD98642.1 LPS-assembly protein LptD [Psychrobacter frigidicola]
MLYSPLYQSIRLILFGALSLTVSAAATASLDIQTTKPLITPSTGAGSSAFKAANNTIVANANNFANDIDTDDPAIDIANNDNADNITEITENTDKTAVQSLDNPQSVGGTQLVNSTQLSENSSVNDSVKTSKSNKWSRKSIKNKSSADDSKINVKDANIQESLQRLAEFYKLKPDADTNVIVDTESNAQQLPTNDNQLQNSGRNSDKNNAQTLPKLGTNLNLLPSSVDSAQRCEGQWVYPSRNPNYQRAVNDGQTPTNLNGIPNNQAPLFTESDYGYYDNVDYAELSGNVIIDQGTQHIEADKIVLDLTTGVAGAQGKVMFTDQTTGNDNSVNGMPTSALPNNTPRDNNKTNITEQASQGGLIGVADSLAYSTETGQSTAYGVAFASVPLQAHGYAKRLNRPNESQYELDNVMFSTCPPTDRKWQLEAKSIDLDTDTGRGKAYDTTFRIADIPVFYLPYFNFPIDNRRGSGFLLPSASLGSKSGLEVDVPYYLNLAPNYDATINTHVYTNRNPMLSGEFRYLTENYGEGIFNGSYLPNDKEYDGKDRSSFFYDHFWSSSSIPRLSGDAKYSYVSDEDYINDFDTLGLSDNTLNLPRRARLNYYNDYVSGEIKVETFQTLNAFTNTGEALEDKDKPYSRLPQLTLNYRLPWAESFDITGVHDSAYFKKSIDDGSEDEKSGVRVYNKISAAYPIESSWGYVKPELSLQHLYTSYDQDSLEDNELSKADGSQSVFVPQASVDAGLYFYRGGSPFGAFDDTMGGYQILSPRLKYTYSPYKDQNDIPNFNTRIASINYEQLFSDSWFLGHDRLQDLHAFTPGVNYRYIDATGVTRFDGSIAEQFYIDDGRVTLEDQKPVFTASSSGMVWNASAQPYNNVWVDVSGAFNNSYDLNFITTELRYQPTENSLFNVGFVKRQLDDNTNQLPLSAFTASAIFPVNNNWRVLAQGQYDYRRDKILDSLVGIDYEDCCFGFAVYGRRYYNDLNVKDKPTQAIMAEVRLNGLGSGASRLTRLLSDKVLGFEPVQTAWKQ